MAKKSTAGKRTGASRRPAASKDSHVTLIRTPSASTATLTPDNAKETTRPASAPKPATQPQRATQPTSRAAQPAARGTTATPARASSATAPAASARSASTAGVPSAVPARATATPAARTPAPRPAPRAPRPSQRSARAVNLVTAEHYAYVKRDLVMIGVLATTMFAFIIVVYFYLRAQGQV